MDAQQVWADFDELMDIKKVANDINLANHANLVKKVSLACAQQNLTVLHHLHYNVKPEFLQTEIKEMYEEWNDLYFQLLNL